MRLRNVVAALGLAMVSAVGTAAAAPTMAATNLPIDDQLRAALAARGKSEQDIEKFLNTLARIQVYDDHKNPIDPERGDRSKPKIFWAAPFFTPSQARSAVGAEQFADYALEIIDNTDHLLGSFEFEANEFLRLGLKRKEINKKIADVDEALRGNLDPIARASLEALRPVLVAELARVEADILALVSAGRDGASELGTQ